ncbi:MAG: hypothetical protein IKS64_05540 [Muribaculaceae bacterium]|nr:hypothetical protein [Muribaculaceae bacterium]
MSQMNQEMYGASGKCGNKTYYQRDGKTIGRIIVTPKNPKSDAQTLQRILVKVVGMVYAMLKAICNHSFEGFSNGAKCAERFRSLNLRYLRERATALQQSGQSLAQFYQFAPLQSGLCTPFAAIISQGHLPKVRVGIDAEGGHVAYVNTPGRTYADFVKAWGLQRGDQVSFVTVQKNEGEYEAYLARIVLNPRNDDGSGAPMSTEIVDSEGEFPCSNWKNRLNFSTFEFDTDHFNFVLGNGGIVVAAGIIISRKDKSGDWFRSNCQLVLNEAGFGSDLCSLAEAVESSYVSSDIDMESELYLNNAGTGGTGSTGDVTPSGGSGGVTPGEPTYNTMAAINGVSQSIAGGSVTATAPVTTVAISGNNLGEVVFTAKVDGTGDAINPTSHNANGATFSGLNVEAGHSLVVYRGGTVWFTISAQESGGSGFDEG